MLKYKEHEVSGVKTILLDRYIDQRGWLNESWRDSWNHELGTDIRFTQDAWAFSEKSYTLRGLHSFRLPARQNKLVMVLKGSVFDVVVDMREDSPTKGKYLHFYLSESTPMILLIPPGCYHGYLTLEPETFLGYKTDYYYSPEYDSGLRWNDPTLNIDWPLNGNTPIISEKDQNHPLL